MGWGNCGTDSKGRPIGYVFEAKCDHPGCTEKIDRGLSYACGGMHGENGGYDCEGYFCPKHRSTYVDTPEGDALVVCHSCRDRLLADGYVEDEEEGSLVYVGG